jgi:hypothetical protein
MTSFSKDPPMETVLDLYEDANGPRDREEAARLKSEEEGLVSKVGKEIFGFFQGMSRM